MYPLDYCLVTNDLTNCINKTTEMVKIGLLGVGHLGKIHLKCLQNIETITISGFYDPDDKAAQQILAAHPQLQRFDSVATLIDQSDALDIVTPTITHFELAAAAIQKGKHVFIEKPLTSTLAEAEKLVALAQGKAVKIQVGYVERFNPCLLYTSPSPRDRTRSRMPSSA